METLEIVLLSDGLVLIIVTLVMALMIPKPSVFQLWVFRVIMALGGAIALFLVIYLMNPPTYVKDFIRSKD